MPAPKGSRNRAIDEEDYSKVIPVAVSPTLQKRYKAHAAKHYSGNTSKMVRDLVDADIQLKRED